MSKNSENRNRLQLKLVVDSLFGPQLNINSGKKRPSKKLIAFSFVTQEDVEKIRNN